MIIHPPFKQWSHIWNQHSWTWKIAKLHSKQKRFNLRTSGALFEYFWNGIWKPCSHILSQYPRLFLNLRPKIPYLGIYIRASNLKSLCIILNQYPWICLIIIFLKILETLNVGAKKPDLGIFGPQILKAIVIFEINTIEFVKY